MNHSPFAIWCAVLTVLLVGIAVFTDLRWRRIPNILTFSAFCLAVVVRLALQGLPGFGLGIAGAIVAPTLLILLHGGRGLGMGDLKLAAAIGSIVGPVLAAVAMIITAIAGGALAIIYLTRPGGQLFEVISIFSIGNPFLRRAHRNEKGNLPDSDDSDDNVAATMPYGVAIAVGSITTLATCWLTGNEYWFLSLVGIPTAF